MRHAPTPALLVNPTVLYWRSPRPPPPPHFCISILVVHTYLPGGRQQNCCPILAWLVFASFGRVPAWDAGKGGVSADGLWEAAGDGRVGDGEATELKSKAPVWSSTTESFELDLMEVCRGKGASISSCLECCTGSRVS